MKKAKKKAPQTIITSFKRDLAAASDQHLTQINSLTNHVRKRMLSNENLLITSSINPNNGLNN